MARKTNTFNPHHIFVDTNVLIGAYSGDVRFQKDSECLHYLSVLVGKQIYISSLSVASMIYLGQFTTIRLLSTLRHSGNAARIRRRQGSFSKR